MHRERGVGDTARRNLDVVRQTYQHGSVLVVDVIPDQRRFIDVEVGYIEALKQVPDAIVEVQRAIGGRDR